MFDESPNLTSKARPVRRRWLAAAAWVALAAALPPAGARASDAGLRVDDATTTIEELGIPLAIRQAYTLRDDFSIRITNSGFQFLAKQIQLILNGWVRRDRVQFDAPNSIQTLLGSFVNGLAAGFDAVVGPACIKLHNTNDDDGDGARCTCAGLTKNSVSLWSSFENNSCANCLPGAAGNPTPAGPWGVDSKNRGANMWHGRYGTNSSGCPNENPAGGGHRVARYKDPANPQDTTLYWWCKGPYYDSALGFRNQRVDPDCLFHPTDDLNGNGVWNAGEYCPEIYGQGSVAGTLAANVTLGCDGVCNTTSTALNDVRVTMTNNLAQQRIDLTIVLPEVRLDAWLGLKLLSDCCWWGSNNTATGEGTLLSARDLTLTGDLKFVNGYYSMLGRDGEAYSTSSGSSSGSSTSTSGGGSCAVSGSSSGSSGTPPDTSLNNHALVGAELGISGAALGGSLNIVGDYGVCADQWFSECGLVGAILGAIDSLLTGLIEDTVRDLLGSEIQPLIDEELGLPLDFVDLIGSGIGLAKDLCGLRMPAGNPWATCSHAARNCACDDYDNDGLLNYQDPTPGITPSGCPAGTWCGFDKNGEMYYSWWWGLSSLIGGWKDSAPPFFEVGAYVDDRWDTGGVNLVVDLSIVPYRRANETLSNAANDYSTLAFPSDVAHYGYFPDPLGASGRGPYWNSANGWPLRSCYPTSALFLDSTTLNNDMLTRNDAYGPDQLGAGWYNMLDDWDGVAPGGIHFGFILSQQLAQEMMYWLYSSGLLCFEFDENNFPAFGSLLQVANLKALVPMLGDAPGGVYTWRQDASAMIRVRPSAVPQARVLGARNGCFPAGDVISSDTIFNSHSELDVHVPQSCAGTPAAAANRVYDALIYLPALNIEFHAPRASDNQMIHLFTMNWDLGLAAALEYSLGLPNGGTGTEWGGNSPKFFEILLDAFLGCGGTLFGGTAAGNWTGFDPPGSVAAPTCGIVAGAIPLTQVEKGISGFMHGIFNAAFSFMLQTKILLGGLDIDFYRVGHPNQSTFTQAQLDRDAVGDYGYGTGDYLVLAGRFAGNIDFAGLIGILGGLATPLEAAPTGLDTYITPVASPVPLAPAAQDAGDWIALSPGESYALGVTSNVAEFWLSSRVSGVVEPQRLDGKPVYDYSWRLNDGFWRPWAAGSLLRLSNLPNGRHDLEVRSRLGGALVDETPARISFWVDTLAPDIFLYDAADRWLAPAGKEETVHRVSSLVVDVEDNASVAADVRIEYRFNDGRWQGAPAGRISLAGLPVGDLQVLEVRATDEFANVRTERYAIVPVAAGMTGSGCGVTPDGGPDRALIGLAAALMLALLYRSGRLRGRREVRHEN